MASSLHTAPTSSKEKTMRSVLKMLCLAAALTFLAPTVMADGPAKPEKVAKKEAKKTTKKTTKKTMKKTIKKETKKAPKKRAPKKVKKQTEE
jgi:topoisomerase IA-like protein